MIANVVKPTDQGEEGDQIVMHAFSLCPEELRIALSSFSQVLSLVREKFYLRRGENQIATQEALSDLYFICILSNNQK